uniref:SHSP domain-containing protein n=1 Tax=Cuerna arida TaxID=1464854 RepID=A0A1B6GAG5_9HEMI
MLSRITSNIIRGSYFQRPSANPWLGGPFRSASQLATTTSRRYTYRLEILGGTRHDYDVRLDKRDVVIRGLLEDRKQEGGRASYRFVRRHQLPKEVDLASVEADKSEKGFVVITANMKN